MFRSAFQAQHFWAMFGLVSHLWGVVLFMLAIYTAQHCLAVFGLVSCWVLWVFSSGLVSLVSHLTCNPGHVLVFGSAAGICLSWAFRC